MRDWMIYGAYGYTGELITKLAIQRGMRPILAGRHAQRMLDLGRSTGLPTRVFDLKKPAQVARHLEGVGVVLHCAGPFSATAKPMLEACMEAHCHYLDITGEIDVFEMIHARSEDLKAAGVTAIPGVGFDVVPTDCLATMLKKQLPDANELTLAFALRGKGAGFSRGTAKTMVEGLGTGGRVRRDGRLESVPAAYKTRKIPFADKERSASTIPWGDVATAYYSTGIPNIEVYMGMSPRNATAARLSGHMRWLLGLKPVEALLKLGVDRSPPGPTDAERAASQTYLWGEVTNTNGEHRSLSMRTPNGYSLTADSALHAVSRILSGGIPTGMLTPSLAFGADFVKELEGVEVLA